MMIIAIDSTDYHSATELVRYMEESLMYVSTTDTSSVDFVYRHSEAVYYFEKNDDTREGWDLWHDKRLALSPKKGKYSHSYYIKQPKPKSRLKARLYK